MLDDDVDPANDRDLLWGLATSVHPVDRKEVRMGGVHPIMLCYTDEERHSKHGPLAVSHVLQSAARQRRLPHSSLAQAYPAEIQAKVLARWDD